MVIQINLAGCRLLNVERKQLIGRPLLPFVTEEDRREFLGHLRRCRSSKGVVETELRFARPDTEVVIKFTDAGGTIVVHTTTATDGVVRVTIRDSGTGMDAAVYFPLVEEGHQPDLGIAQEVVVDHPEACALALASAPISPPQLPKATSPWHDIAGFWLGCQERLQRPGIHRPPCTPR